MNQQKIVVILLLVTIILSVFSVIITMGVDVSQKVRSVYTKETVTNSGPQAGNINLAVVSPPKGGSG